MSIFPFRSISYVLLSAFCFLPFAFCFSSFLFFRFVSNLIDGEKEK